MPYRPLEDLLAVLHSRTPSLADAISLNRRNIEHGLLSVGLKLHCLGDPIRFGRLIDELGGKKEVLGKNIYKRDKASFCLVLPPVGSARTAIQLVEALEHFTGSAIFNNPEVQIQVCSPSRLSYWRAGLLAMAFYLGSDIIRPYKLEELETTFSRFEERPEAGWGARLVLYDAPQGTFERSFPWWGSAGETFLLEPELPFGSERTDVLTGRTRRDIENINLVATLLSHTQQGGYWGPRGRRFEGEMRELLQRHGLEELIFAPWIRTGNSTNAVNAEDVSFLAALDTLRTYALEDVARSEQTGRRFWRSESSKSILGEMKELLSRHRREVIDESRRLTASKRGVRT